MLATPFRTIPLAEINKDRVRVRDKLIHANKIFITEFVLTPESIEACWIEITEGDRKRVVCLQGGECRAFLADYAEISIDTLRNALPYRRIYAAMDRRQQLRVELAKTFFRYLEEWERLGLWSPKKEEG